MTDLRKLAVKGKLQKFAANNYEISVNEHVRVMCQT